MTVFVEKRWLQVWNNFRVCGFFSKRLDLIGSAWVLLVLTYSHLSPEKYINDSLNKKAKLKLYTAYRYSI